MVSFHQKLGSLIFDPKYYIQIETDALGYAISGVLNRLVLGTRSDRVVTKTDLS